MTQYRKSVLVVEDDADMREVLEHRLPAILAEVGLENPTVLMVRGVTPAIALLRQQRPDLIITDHSLGDGTGYDIVTFLVSKCDIITRLVMMTDSPDSVRDDERFRMLGEHRLLAKPVGTEHADFVPWIEPLRKVLNGK